MKLIGWERFQGYTKRGPPWIKLHTNLIDQPQYLALPLVARAVLPALWITAARLSDDGSLPDDLRVLSVLSHVAEAEIRQALPPLRESGFVLCDEVVAGHATGLSQQTERETEAEIETEEAVAKPQLLVVEEGKSGPEPPLHGVGRRGKRPVDYTAPIAAFNRAFALAFRRRATLPPDKDTTFAARVAEGYPVEFLIGCPVGVRAAGLDQGRDVQPAFLLRNGSGSYTRNGETRRTFDWIGSLWQAADRLTLTPAHAEMLREVGVLGWWIGRGATIQTPGGDEC